MDKQKETGLNKLFNEDKSTADNYKASNNKKSKLNKATNHSKPQTNDKSINNKSKKSTRSKKDIRPSYSNIRTNTNIVDELKAYQIVDGDKSRSDLLSRMIKICKPVIINSSAKKEKFHKTIKLIKISRQLKE